MIGNATRVIHSTWCNYRFWVSTHKFSRGTSKYILHNDSYLYTESNDRPLDGLNRCSSFVKSVSRFWKKIKINDTQVGFFAKGLAMYLLSTLYDSMLGVNVLQDRKKGSDAHE